MKKMRNLKGFTLIELLAVIVILAVIALIAVPQILKILNKARLSAAEDSTMGIVKSAESYVTNFMLKNSGTLPSEELVFNCNGTSCDLQTTLSGYNLEGLDGLDFKGTKPKSGIIRISNNGANITTSLEINGFSCNYPVFDSAICSKGNETKNNEYVSDNLLVRYNYEDSSNTSSVLKDLSGNGYDGAINGATITNDGLVFDGVDDYVSIAEINTPNLTWEVSFKALNIQSHLVSNADIGGVYLGFDNKSMGGNVFINSKWEKVYSKSDKLLNELYFLTFSYDGTSLKLYVNGILENQVINNGSKSNPLANTILILGADPSGNMPEVIKPSFFNGSIYSVRIYDRALNEAEIKYNYLIDSARYKE